MRAAEAVASARAAWWAARSIRTAMNVELVSPAPAQLPSVPSVPEGAVRGVELSLRITRANCLTRAVLLQAWHLAHGDARDLVIGVTAPGGEFGAHAWLDGDDPCHTAGFHELTRRPAV